LAAVGCLDNVITSPPDPDCAHEPIFLRQEIAVIFRIVITVVVILTSIMPSCSSSRSYTVVVILTSIMPSFSSSRSYTVVVILTSIMPSCSSSRCYTVVVILTSIMPSCSSSRCYTVVVILTSIMTSIMPSCSSSRCYTVVAILTIMSSCSSSRSSMLFVFLLLHRSSLHGSHTLLENLCQDLYVSFEAKSVCAGLVVTRPNFSMALKKIARG
jgi:hypothetical protein